MVENILGKGENAGYQHFPTDEFYRMNVKIHIMSMVTLKIHLQLLPIWKDVKFCHLTFSTLSQLLTTLRKKPFENIAGKGENAGNQHFLLFLQCFLHISKQISIFQLPFSCICFQFGLV